MPRPPSLLLLAVAAAASSPSKQPNTHIAAASLLFPHAPTSHRRARPAMGCFLGCFGGDKSKKERHRRRRKQRSPSHSPGAARARHSPSKADRDAEAASAAAPLLATLLELRDSADDLCLAVVAKKKVTFDPNVTAYEAPAIPEGGRSTVVERGGAGDEQGASDFVLDETVHPDGGSCVAQLDAGVGFQFRVGMEMQLQSLPLLLAALLCRSGEGFPAVQTRDTMAAVGVIRCMPLGR